MTRPVSRRDVERELARARGARRMLPWAALSAVGAAAIGLAAGGGARAALVLLALGLSFALYLWTTAIARCPACGAPLPAGRRKPGPAAPPDPAEGERIRSCPRCLVRFDA